MGQWDETELSEAIKAVRAGLTAAQQDGADSAIRFTVKEIVLDLGIELRRTTAAGGGVKAFVVSGEARGERVGTATHRLTVTLEVAGPDEEAPGAGGRVLIGDRGGVGDLPSGTAFR
ncbi:trypco2 family protein [Streptomyces sp. NPDC006527]|uniref:trypco2 family protein n=1 Tax=Streptomyces sp. NPDC006527 TaxID=3364749 RepID=UPI0036C69740